MENDIKIDICSNVQLDTLKNFCQSIHKYSDEYVYKICRQIALIPCHQNQYLNQDTNLNQNLNLDQILDQDLDQIKDQNKNENKYENNDDKTILYMPNFNNIIYFLVIMRKTEKTITNEKRNNVFNSTYAMFRGNIFEVVLIVDIKKLTIVDSIQHTRFGAYKIHYIRGCESTVGHESLFRAPTVINYEIGKTICPHEFDNDINQIGAPGIHYFKSIDAAFYLYFSSDFPDNYTGKWYEFYSDGRLSKYYEYVDGKLNGKHLSWWETGIVRNINEYIDGRLSGKLIEYFYNGNVRKKEEYVNGRLDNMKTKYYADNTHTKSVYDNGKLLQTAVYVNNTLTKTYSYDDNS